MLTYSLKKDHGHSLYAALYEHIRTDIANGRLAAGERLPSKRALAEHLGVSIATVESAYAQLVAEGYAESRERSGVFVCAIGELPPRPAAHPAPVPAAPPAAPVLDLSSGSGSDTPFPLSVWMRTMREIMAEQDILHPVDFRGAVELRRAIADYLYRARGLSVWPEQILVGAGNEYLYGLLVQLLGRDRRYAVEDPGYPKISGIYGANDAHVCHIPLDEDGMRVDALTQSGAHIAHISPAHHYPTGIVMPIRRRTALLDWACAQDGRYIIEDDYDSELRHRGKPVPPLFSLDSHQRVIYLSTFSQTIAPSLRIAYVCLPPQLMAELQQRLGFYSSSVPTFEQYTLGRFIASGNYERHINRLRKRFRDKRTAILDMIAASPLSGKCGIIEENAGTHLLLQLHTRRTDGDLKAAAAEHGLGIRFLREYCAVPKDSGCMILNYACLPLDALPPALETLAALLG